MLLPLIPATKSFTGIDDINMSPSYSTGAPFSIHVMLNIFPSFVFMSLTSVFITIFPPIFFMSSATASHNCPGPYLGYMYSSINDVSTFAFFFFGNIFEKTSLITAVIDKPFTRCEPQSADISLGCLPQSFSVYPSKNIEYKTLPNLFM